MGNAAGSPERREATVAVVTAHPDSGALLKTETPRRTAVGLTGGSSKQSSLLRRLAEELPALLRRRKPRAKSESRGNRSAD